MYTMETEYMKSNNTDVEDGELSGSDESYTPLQRPEELAKVEAKFVPNVTPMEELSEQDDLTNCSSGDTSDSDNNTLKIKRKKTKGIRLKSIEMLQKTAHLQQNYPQSSKTNRAKYNIWTQSLQEDTLLENMRGCDVTNEDKRCDRAVESYDYNIVYRMNGESSINNKLKRRLSNSDDSDNHTHFANKRFRAQKHSGYKGVKSRLGLRSDDSGSNDSNCNNSPRYILDLKDSVDSTDDDIAKEIANKLCEQKDELMIRVVDVIGKDIPIKLFKETQEIELNGGMLIMNGMRRRTPGGVFLYLLKNSEEVSQDDKKRIFREDSRQSVKERKLSQALKREKKVEELKRSLSRNDKELAVLPTRKELIMSHLKPETTHTLSNPPPSPSDGNRENSPDYDTHHVNVTSPEKPTLNKEETANGYNDDFLDMHCDDMDMF